MADELIGRAFPSGGPVEPEYVIGREGDIANVCERLRERVHTMIAGDRRIGKTTVCNAACARLHEDGYVIVKVEVPERSTPQDLCQFIIERCDTQSRTKTLRKAVGALTPLIEKLLEDAGLPLNLDALEGGPTPAQQRTILSLPIHLAADLGKPVVFFLDELQRVVDYADGERFLSDLVDVYAGGTDVVVLIDGSNTRTLAGLFQDPVKLGKLAERTDLPPTISRDQWRQPLRERFASTGLRIGKPELETILDFGAERPYHTMTAARHVALIARRVDTTEIDAFIVREGLQAAEAALADDDG